PRHPAVLPLRPLRGGGRPRGAAPKARDDRRATGRKDRRVVPIAGRALVVAVDGSDAADAGQDAEAAREVVGPLRRRGGAASTKRPSAPRLPTRRAARPTSDPPPTRPPARAGRTRSGALRARGTRPRTSARGAPARRRRRARSGGRGGGAPARSARVART